MPALTLEQLTKATGKMVQIDPDTGDPVLDEKGLTIIVPKRTLSPSKAAMTMGNALMLRMAKTDTSDRAKIWWYDGGIWRPDGERDHQDH
ncbi:Uncharacterised protein [uncultured archaeon]|nr:Uncharacterised protein [uncultured archaeon]